MAQLLNSPVVYWLGSTAERFTISDTDLIESSDLLTFNPNQGTRNGPELDFVWINNNFNVTNKFTFKGTKHHLIDTIAGQSHALIIVPSDLAVTGISETVFGGPYPMTENLHYSMFTILNGIKTFNIYYLRDLTHLKFQKRQFQFDVSIA